MTRTPRTSGRARQGLRQVRLLAAVARRSARDDPALLAVQSVRRLPPRVRSAASRTLLVGAERGSATPLRLLGCFLADRPSEVRDRLPRSRPRTGFGRRLTAELAVQVGRAVPADAAPSVRAREAWSHGDLTRAIEVLADAPGGPARRQLDRLTSERRTMTPGYRVPAPRTPVTARPTATAPYAGAASTRSAPADGARALHLLTNSLPRTSSGYTLRSHAILRAQHAEGVAVEAATRLGYPVTVGLPGTRETDVVDGVRYHRLLPSHLAATPEGRLEQTAELLLPLVGRFRPTVLHTTTHFTNALVVQAVAEATARPWVYEVRGQLEKTWLAGRPESERARAAASERFRLFHDKETEMARAADHVVALSETLRADLVRRGVPAEDITVMPNAVETDLLSTQVDAREARRRVGLPAEGFWVGTVSSLVHYEGIDVMLDAVALLRRRGLDVRCAVVGDGTERPSLLAQVERLGIGDAVVMPGRVHRAEAADWHRALDVFVVARRDVDVCRTVTPLKPIEAMAVGRPVVASDLPALAEIVAAPRTGLLARAEDPEDLASAIATLHADASSRHELGTAGRAFAATRTWPHLAAGYRQLYERLGGRS